MATKQSSKKSSSPKTSGKINVGVDKDSSVSMRQIENGFLVSESGYTGKGKNQKWYNKEYFVKNNPLKGLTGMGSGNQNSGNGGKMKFGGNK